MRSHSDYFDLQIVVPISPHHQETQSSVLNLQRPDAFHPSLESRWYGLMRCEICTNRTVYALAASRRQPIMPEYPHNLPNGAFLTARPIINSKIQRYTAHKFIQTALSSASGSTYKILSLSATFIYCQCLDIHMHKHHDLPSEAYPCLGDEHIATISTISEACLVLAPATIFWDDFHIQLN